MTNLNSYVAEAKDFLEKINGLDEGIEQKVKFLEEEFQLLKSSIEANEAERIRHQIYDMLFLLFEISADYDFDLDNEWGIGREMKERKYLNRGK